MEKTSIAQRLRSMSSKTVKIIVGLLVLAFVVDGMFIYNEANHKTYVRTFWGAEYVYDSPGLHLSYFGRSSIFTDSLTIQTVIDGQLDMDGLDGKIVVPAYDVQFLNNTGSGTVETSTRFQFPSGEQFKELAREYRTQENFANTMLIPSVRTTLNNTASMMTADDYFGGSKGEFNLEFENQLKNGLYILKRKEVARSNLKKANAAAIAGGGEDQGTFGNNQSTFFVTEKVLDKHGNPLRKELHYGRYGVDVIEAQTTNMAPSAAFAERIKKIQDSQAKLMLARQDRLAEEENKRLVIAQGEKATEQERQAALKEQAKQTTEVETAKQVAITTAEQQMETAEIAEKTSEIALRTAKLDAERIRVTAEALAYEKEALLEADGALQQKLEAIIKINEVWAAAAAKAPVPGIVLGGVAGTGNSINRQSEITDLMQLLTVKTAKDLNNDMTVK